MISSSIATNNFRQAQKLRLCHALGGAAVIALTLLLILLALAPAAHAAVTHEYLPTPSKTLPTGVPESCPLEHCITGPLSDVNAMTVDSAHHVFIAEKTGGSTRLDEFDDSTGAFIRQFPQDASLSSLDAGVAAAHETGFVYDAGAEGLAVYSATGELKATWTGVNTESERNGAPFASLHGVGVDNSTGHWTAGDVLVLNGNEKAVDVLKPEANGEEPINLAIPPLTGTCANPGENAAGPTPCATLTPFTNPVAITVNATNGDLLVLDRQERTASQAEYVVDVFEPAGLGEFLFVRQLTGTVNGAWEYSTALPVRRQVARIAAGVGGDIYVAEEVLRVEDATVHVEYLVDQFNGEGTFVGRLAGTPTRPFKTIEPQVGSVAVDPVSGDVFVGSFESPAGFVDVFGPDLVIPDVAVTPVTSFRFDQVSHTWATALNGTVNPLSTETHEGASCEFEYGLTPAYGQHASCEPPHVAEGDTPAPVKSAPVAGLLPDTSYFYRVDANNANGTSTGLGPEDEGSFTTPGPRVVSDSATDVTSTSATLQASIVPHEEPASPRANPVSYFFEYGPTVAYGSQTPGATIGPGETAVDVSQHVQGLAPAGEYPRAGEYHYRVVAVAEVETAGTVQVEQFPGPDHVFTTQPPASTEPVLLDGRQWELVSPTDKHGALILKPLPENPEGGLVAAAAGGGAISYVTDAPTEAAPAGYANDLQVLALRGPAGWSSRDIAVPHLAATGPNKGLIFVGSEYAAFSEDLSLGVVQPYGGFDPAVSREASEQTAYERSDFTAGGICPSPAQEAARASCYTPLLTARAPFADVTSGLAFSTAEDECPPQFGFALCAPEFVTATPDARHVLVRTDAETKGIPEVPLTGAPGDEGGLYEWSAGVPPAQRLALVSVLPNEKDAPSVHVGSVSEDGSLVFFADAGHSYMRDVPLGKTIELAGGFEGVFAYGGGSRVLAGGRVCEVTVSGAGEPECPEVGAGISPGASRLGASRDGSVLYFTSQEALTGSEANAHGEIAQAGQPNLYVRQGAGLRLVAVLSPDDHFDWGQDAHGVGHTSSVSPNGRWLAFMSDRSLTGYDNSGPHCVPVLNGGEEVVGYGPGGCSEVYVYDAQTGNLVCASCNPSGARPLGPSRVPGLTGSAQGYISHQSRYVSDSGRLFFDSRDALVAQDVNGAGDVYEWEPAGVPEGSAHACASSTAGYSPGTGGCLGLVSSGASSEESSFLEASESGGDVFFLSTSKLSLEDTDTSYDVYDAHECTSASPCVAQAVTEPSACSTADSCRAAQTPQPEVFGAPSSSTFSGPGNIQPPPPPPPVKKPTRAQQLAGALKSCRARHSHRSKRVACERAARKRYAAKKASLHAKRTRRG